VGDKPKAASQMETKPAATLGSKWATKQTIPWTNTNQRPDELVTRQRTRSTMRPRTLLRQDLELPRHVSEKVDSEAIAQVVLAWVMVASWVELVVEDSMSKLA
jgi:hypothetical protein